MDERGGEDVARACEEVTHSQSGGRHGAPTTTGRCRVDEDEFLWAIEHADDVPDRVAPAVWRRVLDEGPIVALVFGPEGPDVCQVVCALPNPEAGLFAEGRVAFLSNQTRLNATPEGWQEEVPAVRLALLPLSRDGQEVWVDEHLEPAPDDPHPRVLHFDLRSAADRNSLEKMLSQDELLISFLDASEGRLVRHAVLEPSEARPELMRFLVEAELRFPDEEQPMIFELPDALD